MTTKKLRNKILDLAIHGRLVKQDPNDEPASALLARIRAEKEQLVKEGKLKKKDLVTTPVSDEDKPFEVPEGWEWCRLGDLAFYKKGPFGSSLTKAMFVPDTPNVYKVYEQKNAIQKDESLGNYYITKEKFEELKGFEVYHNDIIVSCAGTIGETFVMPKNIRRGVINQALMLIRLHLPVLQDFYLLYFDFFLKEEAAKESKGTAIKNIPPFDVLKNYAFPLPPLAEQQRIVAAVEQWMSLIDVIESGQENLQQSIALAKNKILDLAIKGKLVPQDANDEPASVLLEHIRKEKEQLVKEGKLKKKDLVTTPVSDEDKPFEVPEGWEWCRLQDIGTIITGSTPSKDHTEYYGGDFPFYKPSDLDQGINTVASTDSLSYAGYTVSRQFPKNSILVTCIGATIGKTGLIKNEGSCNQQINGIIPVSHISPYYIYFLCLSDNIQNEIKRSASATTLPILNKNNFAIIPIPLPPLSEQQRIVAKIEELFAQLDNIANALK